MKKIFIFDLYNTLIEVRTDEHCAKAWKPLIASLKAQGVSADWKTLAALFDTTWSDHIARAEAEGKYAYPECDEVEIFSDIIRAAGGTTDYNGAAAALWDMRFASIKKLRPFPGTAGLLGQLRAAGAGIYLLSNAQAAFTYGEIEKCGLADAFDGVLLSSECGVRKPDPAFFAMLFDKYGPDKSRSVMVGDDETNDGQGAAAFGIDYVKADGGAVAHAAELLALLGGAPC